jgi:hypothetical protein
VANTLQAFRSARTVSTPMSRKQSTPMHSQRC